MQDALPAKRGFGAAWVIGTVLTLAVVLGVVAFMRYEESERIIQRDLADMKARGAALSAEECVTAVIAWRNSCGGIPSLCDHALPMAVVQCMGAADRTAECPGYLTSEPLGKWTFQMCGARGIDKPHGMKKPQIEACANTYEAVSNYCLNAQKGVTL